ncbi:glycosyltransferase family 4 protein [Alteraurantiacibacter aestuarii]|uniref:glycosyltransferase n=1 Tax=Alteraurantiacibacter aestuarii TaxID=650004 RepID=UPI0031D88258
MHLVILTREIGHYHDARYRGAARVIDRVSVISSMNEAGFAQFLAKDTGSYAIEKLFESRAAYHEAVGNGRLQRAMEAALASLAPDVLAISGWSNPESMIAMRWGRRNGVRLIMMSESQLDDAARNPLREAIKRRVVSQCDASLVGGPPHARYIATLGIPVDRIHMGYNAVDNGYFASAAADARGNDAPLRAQLSLPARYMLASSRFIAKKNLPALVGAYADCVAASDEALPDLVILGDGETRSEIVQAAREGNVEARVHLPGFHGYGELPAFYALAELFIHVSTVEQWGLVINEAMASATPVLVSDCCGATRTLVQDGVSGLVTPPTRRAMAQNIQRFFAMDSAQRAQMAQAGAKAVADWGPDRFGAGMRAAIDSAQAAPQRGALLPWDAAILRLMERTVVERVA